MDLIELEESGSYQEWLNILFKECGEKLEPTSDKVYLLYFVVYPNLTKIQFENTKFILYLPIMIR